MSASRNDDEYESERSWQSTQKNGRHLVKWANLGEADCPWSGNQFA